MIASFLNYLGDALWVTACILAPINALTALRQLIRQRNPGTREREEGAEPVGPTPSVPGAVAPGRYAQDDSTTPPQGETQ